MIFFRKNALNMHMQKQKFSSVSPKKNGRAIYLTWGSKSWRIS